MQYVSTLSMSRAMQDSYVETYLTIITEVEDDDGVWMHIPTEISNVVAKYADWMHDKFLKVLPPWHVVNHHIELESGKQTPTKALYCLSRLKLEDLKWKLKDLTNASFVQPSRSPYGAPVLFQRKKGMNELGKCCDYHAINK